MGDDDVLFVALQDLYFRLGLYHQERVGECIAHSAVGAVVFQLVADDQQNRAQDCFGVDRHGVLVPDKTDAVEKNQNRTSEIFVCRHPQGLRIPWLVPLPISRCQYSSISSNYLDSR